MIRDHWDEALHGACDGDCSFILHGLLELYAKEPSSPEPLTALDKILVQLFEMRFTLDFILDDAGLYGQNPSPEIAHYLAMSALQRLPIELYNFKTIHAGLYGALDDADKNALSHLSPIYKSMRSVLKNVRSYRNLAAHLDSGIYGIAEAMSKAEHGNASRLLNSFLLCALLATIFIDGVIHIMPDRFCLAVSRLPTAKMHMESFDPRSAKAEITSFIAKNPIGHLDFGDMSPETSLIASELMRLRVALQSSMAIYDSIYGIRLGVPVLQRLLYGHKIVFYVKYALVELATLFNLYDKIKKMKLCESDDGVMKRLQGHRKKINELRLLVTHWSSDEQHEGFSVALERRIDYRELLVMAGLAFEWVRINANAFQTEHDYQEYMPHLECTTPTILPDNIEADAARIRKRSKDLLARRH